MVKFVFPSGREGWVYGVRGKMVGSKTWTETHVTSSGGGGYIHQGQGQIHAPTVRSTIVEKGEVWVRSRSGKDICIGHNLQGIEGHDVLALWGNLNEIDTKSGPYLYWRNFSAGKHWLIGSQNRKIFLSGQDNLNGFWAFILGWLASIFGGAIVVSVLSSTDGGWAPGGLLGFFVGIFIGLWVRHSSLNKKINARAKTLLEALEQLSLRDDLEFDG